jgi:hypothetical protein
MYHVITQGATSRRDWVMGTQDLSVLASYHYMWIYDQLKIKKNYLKQNTERKSTGLTEFRKQIKQKIKRKHVFKKC